MRYKKPLIIFLLVVCFILLAILGVGSHWYFTYSYTTTAYNDILEEKLSSRFNQEVSLSEVTVSPRYGIEIHDFKITNKLGFSEEYFLEAPRVQIPIDVRNILNFLLEKELVLREVYLLDSRIDVEISMEEGVNFPQTFPAQFLEPVEVELQEHLPVRMDIRKIVVNNPTVSLTYLDQSYGVIELSEVSATLVDEQILNMKADGVKGDLVTVHSDQFRGTANLILQETPIGAGDITIQQVLFDPLPFAEQFERFFDLPPVRHQSFPSMQLNFNLSDRTLLISDFSGENDTLQFQLTGNIDFDGTLDLNVQYTYSSLPGDRDVPGQTFSVSVTGDLVEQEFSY